MADVREEQNNGQDSESEPRIRPGSTCWSSGTPAGDWPIRGLVAIDGALTNWTHRCQSTWLTHHPKADDDLKTELARRIRDNYGDGEFAFRVSRRGGFQVIGDGSAIVLVASTSRARGHVYHTPDSDDPTQPACSVGHGNRWYPKPVSVLEGWERCDSCPEEDSA